MVTGGYEPSDPDLALDTVAKYSTAGFVNYLPAMLEGRFGHACTKYVTSQGGEVGNECLDESHDDDAVGDARDGRSEECRWTAVPGLYGDSAGISVEFSRKTSLWQGLSPGRYFG